MLATYTFIPEPFDSLACTLPIIFPILGLILMVVLSKTQPEEHMLNRLISGIILILTGITVFILLLSPGSISYAKGDYHRYKGNPDTAEQYFLNAIELGGESRTVVDVKTILLGLYINEERYSDAEELLLASFKEDPREWKDDIEEKLPEILRKQGKHEEARKWESRMQGQR
jgi:tetratricopeptide (TPR) repeat protein